MEVVLIYSHLDTRGGSQRYIFEIADQFTRKGIKCHIFCYYLNRGQCFPELNDKFIINAIHENFAKTGYSDIKSGKIVQFFKSSSLKVLLSVFSLDYLFTKVLYLLSCNKVPNDLL